LSAALAWFLAWLHVPGALLLGPLVVAAAMAAGGAASIVPGLIFRLAHAVVGLLIARTLAAGTVGELVQDWPIFLAGVVWVVAASTGIGWALARWRVLPGTTAVWGMAPGAATAMILMAGLHGADARLVALLQYLRRWRRSWSRPSSQATGRARALIWPHPQRGSRPCIPGRSPPLSRSSSEARCSRRA
jgi:membrane AbrB-like protein